MVFRTENHCKLTLSTSVCQFYDRSILKLSNFFFNVETKNGITCIARRVAAEDKRIGLNKFEQFTTRIDREGKVVDLDVRYFN